MNVSIAVAVRDEAEANRKKQGDIIAVMPGGHQWGKKEVDEYLILEVALPQNITYQQVEWLISRYFSGGVLNWEGTPPPALAKRRFKFDWAKLKQIIQTAGITVDWNRVEDKADTYQPLSVQVLAPGGQAVTIDPTKALWDKYEDRLIRAADFSRIISGG